MVAERAYAICTRLAREHYENFPVASHLLPRATRRHIVAVYAFARIADDFADEGDRPDDERLALLEAWRQRLHDAARGAVTDDGSDEAAVFIALRETMASCTLDVSLFDDLLSAFAQDVRVKRYATWDELLDYCRRSANPVGRLVLRIHGYRDDLLDAQSDAICTALQLTNFWQDLARDWHNGRLYVPRDLLTASSATEEDLARGYWSAGWIVALGEAARRTQLLFDRGRPLTSAVRGRLRWELRATWLGGTRILHGLAAQDFNVLQARPALSWTDGVSLIARAIFWRS